MAQITERILRNSLKSLNIWFLKLQNIHFVPTPADFIALGKINRYLIEVKEVSVYKGYTNFDINRLTQLIELNKFVEQNTYNFSFILLNYRQKTLKQSDIFLIPLNTYLATVYTLNKKSISLDDAKHYFVDCKLNILPGSILDISRYII